MCGFNESHILTDCNSHVLQCFIENGTQQVRMLLGLSTLYLFVCSFVLKMLLSNQCIFEEREEHCKFTIDLFRTNCCRSQHTRELTALEIRNASTTTKT